MSATDLAGEHADAIFNAGIYKGPYPQTDRSKTDLVGTMTGQIGHKMGPAVLYARGGAAWARARYALAGYFVRDIEFAASREVQWGWTAGGGVEVPVNRAWSGFAEYGFVDLGTDRRELPCPTTQRTCGNAGATVIALDLQSTLHRFTVGLDYRF